MIITCPNCSTKFNLNEKLLKPTGSKVQCSKCSHIFKAYPPSPPEEIPALPMAPPPEETIPEPEAEETALPDTIEENASRGNEIDAPSLEDMLGTDTAPAPPEEEEEEEEELENNLDSSLEDLSMEDPLPEEDLSADFDDPDEMDLESMLGTDTEPLTPDEQDEESGMDLDMDMDDPTVAQDDDELMSDVGDDGSAELEGLVDMDESGRVETKETAESGDDLDLSGIEDFLESDEASGKETGADEELDIDLDMDLDLEPEEVAEGDGQELDIDLDLDEGGLDLDLEPENETEEKLDLDLVDDASDETLDLDIEGEDALAEEDLDAEDFDFEIEEETEEPDEEHEEEIDLADLERTLEMDLLEPENSESREEPEDVELEFDFEGDGDDDISDKDGVDLSDINDILDMDEPTDTPQITDDGTEDLELEFDIEDDEEKSAAPKKGAPEKRDLDLEFDTPEETKAAKDRKKTPPPPKQPPPEEKELATTRILKAPVSQKASREREDGGKQKQVVIKKKSNLALIIVLIVLVPLVVAGALVGTHIAGIKLPVVSDVIDDIMGKPAAVDHDPTGTLHLQPVGIESRFVNNGFLGNLLVITGRVRNNYDHPRSLIRVRGRLLDDRGNALATSAVYYCGNALTDSELEVIDRAGIEQRLSNQRGMDGVNVNVAPNGSVPFMIVFTGYPEQMESLIVEQVGSVRGG